MKDLKLDIQKRVEFIKDVLKKSGANGIVFGNSGGKDSALVGILCKMACDNTKSIIMPCSSKQNYGSDKEDGLKNAEQFKIETLIIDLTKTKESLVQELSKQVNLNELAIANIAPRLRMTTLYSIATSENRLVAGTGNKSEAHMGYFTKWGDGAHDFNPISDLTVTEIFEYLKFLDAPSSIIEKAPSAGLFDGQTDEKEMGITYAEIDEYLNTGVATEENMQIIKRYNENSEHKRRMPICYGDKNK